MTARHMLPSWLLLTLGTGLLLSAASAGAAPGGAFVGTSRSNLPSYYGAGKGTGSAFVRTSSSNLPSYYNYRVKAASPQQQHAASVRGLQKEIKALTSLERSNNARWKGGNSAFRASAKLATQKKQGLKIKLAQQKQRYQLGQAVKAKDPKKKAYHKSQAKKAGAEVARLKEHRKDYAAKHGLQSEPNPTPNLTVEQAKPASGKSSYVTVPTGSEVQLAENSGKKGGWRGFLSNAGKKLLDFGRKVTPFAGK